MTEGRATTCQQERRTAVNLDDRSQHPELGAFTYDQAREVAHCTEPA
ncbi:hypothetical protein [Streptomyces sp. NPDC041003]